MNILKYYKYQFLYLLSHKNLEVADSELHIVIKYSHFRSVTLFGVELPHPPQINIQLRNLHLLIQNFTILQLRHTSFITKSFKEIHNGR